jgi:hypothetical protein
MNSKKLFTCAAICIILSTVFFLKKERPFNMSETKYVKTMEPLLLNAGGDTNYYNLLPVGTPLYEDKNFSEGHTRYIAYINIKGPFEKKENYSEKNNLIDPIWAYTIKSDEIKDLLKKVPISQKDLLSLIKSRGIKKDDLIQIIRDWDDL